MSRSTTSKHLTAPTGADLPSHLALQPHQIVAIANPNISLSELATVEPHLLETLGRPIRVWTRKPELAAEVNERLFRAAERARVN